MNRFRRVLTIAVVSFSLVACTSLQVVAEGQAAAASALRGAKPPLTPKDTARITTRDGRTFDLVITSVDGDAVTGMAQGAKDPTIIPIDQIERVERNMVDSSRVLQVVLVIFVVGLAAAYSVGRSFGKFTLAPK